MAAAGLAAPTQAATTAARTATASTTVQIRVRAAIKQLPVAKHSHVGSYDRDKQFGDWASEGNGCDTRAAVLKDESLKATTQNQNCTIETGKWYSYYNATSYTKASSLQIDHTVPVENAWISGAWNWTQATRVRYYNDLGDSRTLVAVDTHDNESKGDQDHHLAASGWQVPLRALLERRQDTLASERHLAEKAKLTKLAASCPNVRLTVTKASIDAVRTTP